MSELETGRVVWRDLMTTDVAQARAFYTELFGWTVQVQDMGPMGEYAMLSAGDKGLGGIVPLDADHGVPSHWINYALVADVDATCARVAELGGKVCVPPFDIPEVGRTAVIEDPSGAVLSPLQSADPADSGASGRPGDHEFCWAELMCDQPDKTATFYAELFDWHAQAMPMGPLTGYFFTRGEAKMATLRPTPEGCGAPNYWLNYVQVADVEAAYERAAALGAKPIHDPTDIPKMGRFAIFSDPTGAVIALWKPVEAAA